MAQFLAPVPDRKWKISLLSEARHIWSRKKNPNKLRGGKEPVCFSKNFLLSFVKKGLTWNRFGDLSNLVFSGWLLHCVILYIIYIYSILSSVALWFTFCFHNSFFDIKLGCTLYDFGLNPKRFLWSYAEICTLWSLIWHVQCPEPLLAKWVP